MPNIVAIDDEQTCLEIIDFSLRSKGHKVFGFDNSIEAIKFLSNSEDKIDAILVDMMMPNMDGIETLERIRQIEKAKFIPIIFQTGTSDYEHLNANEEEHGVTYIIRKPYKRDELIKMVNLVLSKK
ncbi:MAG: response regulator [Pseudomonadota bacterium]